MSLLDEKVAVHALETAVRNLGDVRGVYKILLSPPDQVLLQKEGEPTPNREDVLTFGLMEFSDRFTPAHFLGDTAYLTGMARAFSPSIQSRPGWV